MEARAYAARNRAGSDWFGHNDENNSPAEEARQMPVQPIQEEGEQSGKTAMIKPVCNSNQWFRHDKDQPDTGKENVTAVKHQDNYHHEDHPSNGQTAPEPARTVQKPSHSNGDDQRSDANMEGEANCQRDKAGSDWFSHHDPSKPVANPRAGSAESSNNASKMRNESENWFSHDPNAPSQPLHHSKGRATGGRANQDMYNIFHHNG